MTDDEREIRDLFDRLLAAWTAGDASAYGDCFTEDADYVSFDGRHTHGVAPMVASHDALFRGVLSGSSLVGEIRSIRSLGPDVAVVHALASVLTAWRAAVPRRRRTCATLVVVRGERGWRITAIANVRVRPMDVPPPESWPGRMARGVARLSAAGGIGHRAPGRRQAATTAA